MRALFLSSFCLLALTIQVHAQDPHAHDGFWIGFGVGGGVNVSEGLDNERLIGGTGYLRLGGTPSQRVLLGGESAGWARTRASEVISRGNAMFIAMFFPSENGGFFVKGGVGGAGVTRVVAGTVTTVQTKGGLGTSVGLGFDVRLGGNIYLTPNFDWLFQVFDAGDDPVFGAESNTNSIVAFTLGLTWH